MMYTGKNKRTYMKKDADVDADNTDINNADIGIKGENNHKLDAIYECSKVEKILQEIFIDEYSSLLAFIGSSPAQMSSEAIAPDTIMSETATLKSVMSGTSTDELSEEILTVRSAMPKSTSPASSEALKSLDIQTMTFSGVINFNHKEIAFTDIRQLHGKYAPSLEGFRLVWEHCLVVAILALRLSKAQGENFCRIINIPLISVGALVHDIGTYRLLKNPFPPSPLCPFDMEKYIFHGLEGWLILYENEFGKDIADFAKNHTGVGIDAKSIVENHLPLPIENYVPQNINQEIVMFADAFHSKSNPSKFKSIYAAQQSAARFGQKNLDKFMTELDKFNADSIAKSIHELSRKSGIPIHEKYEGGKARKKIYKDQLNKDRY